MFCGKRGNGISCVVEDSRLATGVTVVKFVYSTQQRRNRGKLHCYCTETLAFAAR